MPENPVYQSDEPESSDFDRRRAEDKKLSANVPLHLHKDRSSPAGHVNHAFDEYKDIDIELRNLSAKRNSRGIRPSIHLENELASQDDPAKDPWAIPELADDGPSWSELTPAEKWKRATFGLLKVIGVLGLLYFFIISLDLLSSSFRLIGGRAAGRTFQESELLSNPVVGLMIGVLVTVVVQSSSTSSSIVIALVSSGMLDVPRAIYIIMGANVGTTITNTLVSLAQSADRSQFRRAFAGATIHDMFNWLTVAILLPLEAATGYLVKLTGAILGSWEPQRSEGSNVELLTAITKPLTNLIIQLDSRVIEDIAKNDPTVVNRSMIKLHCASRANPNQTCQFLFHNTGWTDTVVGIILVLVSLGLLCASLIGIVKVLNSILKGTMAGALRKALNTDFPGRWSFLTGYAAMAIGAGVTFIIQSSSVFTSALTPLVGLGVVSIERMYPLTLGSNIGTTGTGLLAAMASDPKALKPALQVALSHLFFNVTGILIWYPLPFMRRVPIGLAKGLGTITAKYRWFAVVYIIATFLVMPACIIGLTLAGPAVLMGVGIPVLFLIVTIIVINILQVKRPERLPVIVQNWNFLPIWMHSLKPYDSVIHTLSCDSCRCCKSNELDNADKPI